MLTYCKDYEISVCNNFSESNTNMARKRKGLRDNELADLVTKMLDEPVEEDISGGEDSQTLREVGDEFIGM